jgi:hypothetical protein
MYALLTIAAIIGIFLLYVIAEGVTGDLVKWAVTRDPGTDRYLNSQLIAQLILGVVFIALIVYMIIHLSGVRW